MELSRIVESLLFATDRPLTAKALTQALHEAAKVSPGPESALHAKATVGEIEAALARLREALETDSFQPDRCGGSWWLRAQDAARIRRLD